MGSKICNGITVIVSSVPTGILRKPAFLIISVILCK